MTLFRENNILYNVETPTLEEPSFLPFDSLKTPALRLADQHNLDLTGKKMHTNLKKEEIIFHGRHSNSPKKWCQMLKTKVETQPTCEWLDCKVLNNFDIISMVYESVEQWQFVLYNNIISFKCPFLFSTVSWQKLHLRERKTMVCTLIYTVALDQSALEKLQSYCENYI